VKFDNVAEKSFERSRVLRKSALRYPYFLLQGVNGFLDILASFSRSICVKCF